MKDQVIILMEALRLAQAEIDKLRRRRQSVTETVDAVEAILRQPDVLRAIEATGPLVESPSITPEVEAQREGAHCAFFSDPLCFLAQV